MKFIDTIMQSFNPAGLGQPHPETYANAPVSAFEKYIARLLRNDRSKFEPYLKIKVAIDSFNAEYQGVRRKHEDAKAFFSSEKERFKNNPGAEAFEAMISARQRLSAVETVCQDSAVQYLGNGYVAPCRALAAHPDAESKILALLATIGDRVQAEVNRLRKEDRARMRDAGISEAPDSPIVVRLNEYLKRLAGVSVRAERIGVPLINTSMECPWFIVEPILDGLLVHLGES